MKPAGLQGCSVNVRNGKQSRARLSRCGSRWPGRDRQGQVRQVRVKAENISEGKSLAGRGSPAGQHCLTQTWSAATAITSPPLVFRAESACILHVDQSRKVEGKSSTIYLEKAETSPVK